VGWDSEGRTRYEKTDRRKKFGGERGGKQGETKEKNLELAVTKHAHLGEAKNGSSYSHPGEKTPPARITEVSLLQTILVGRKYYNQGGEGKAEGDF